MIDKDGNLVTDEVKLKDMAIKIFEERLENRPINEGLENVKELKEKLSEKVMEVAKNNKTPPRKMKDLIKGLKQLKINKSRDPHQLMNYLDVTLQVVI